MSTDRDSTRVVRSWLQTDEHESADRVLDAVLDQLDTTPQRRATWWPTRRLPEMNNMAKLGIAAAAVVVAALLGYTYFVAPNVGGPGPDGSASPSPSEAATLLQAGPLPPGRHYYDVGANTPVRIDFTVPDGWTARSDGQLDKLPDGAVGIYPAIVTHVYADACASEGTLNEIGGSTDDLVTALTSQQNSEVTGPVDVTIDGYAGQRLDIAIPADLDVATCLQGELIQIWANQAETDFLAIPIGGSASVYIFDIDGDRVVLTTGADSAASSADIAERDAIIASVTFGP